MARVLQDWYEQEGQDVEAEKFLCEAISVCAVTQCVRCR